MDYPGVAVLNRWMEGIVRSFPQSAGSSTVTFDVISPSGLGTIQKIGGWIDVRAHNKMVLIATTSVTNANVSVEILRTSADTVTGVLVAPTACLAGVTNELYNGSLDGIAYVRMVTSDGNPVNTLSASFFIK
jgi:hypothetical protein